MVHDGEWWLMIWLTMVNNDDGSWWLTMVNDKCLRYNMGYELIYNDEVVDGGE